MAMVNGDVFNNDKSDGEPPIGGYSSANQASVAALHTAIGEINNGVIPLLITDGSVNGYGINNGATGGVGAAGVGMIIDINSEDVSTLAHELGHVAGYDEGDHPIEGGGLDKSHVRNDKQDEAGKKPLMREGGGGTEVDKCWCEKMKKLAIPRK
jgi:hypothetical protein